MAIEIQDGFRISTNKPVDDRYVKASQLERDNIPAEMRYLGLKCYVTGDEVEYILKEGLTNDDWAPVGEGDVSGPVSSGDERLARWDGVTGKQLQSSGVILDDSDNMSGLESVTTNAVNVGTLRVSESVDNTSTTDAMIIASTSRVILTNALLESIAGISAPTTGKETTIVNKTGRIVRVVHNHTGFLLDNRFILPDAKDISLRPDASITVISSASYGAHVVKGGSGSGGGSHTLDTLMQLTADEPISDWSNLGGGFSISKVDPLFGDASYVLEMNDLSSATHKVIPVDIGFRGTTVALTLDYLMLDGAARVELLDQDNNLIDGAQFDIPAANGKEKFGTTVFIPNHVTGIRFKAEARATVAGGSFKFDNVQLSSNVLGVIDYSTIPVGTIIESMLTEAQIQAQAGAGIILADGRDVTGSRYHAITGNTHVPDLRGVFLRGKDNGKGLDSERALGNYQADALQGHRHFNTQSLMYIGGSGNEFAGTDKWSRSTYSQTGGTYSDGVNGTPRIANETRPKNVTVNFFIKINDTNLSIIAPTDIVTEKTIAFRWRSPAQATEANLSATGQIGDYVTGQYAANTNTLTQCTTRPDQSDVDMSLNGFQIFARPYNAPSTADSPSRFVIKIAEPGQMAACDLIAFKDMTRQISGRMEFKTDGSEIARGLYVYGFNPVTGLLTIDGGAVFTGITNHAFLFEDNSLQNNAYITFTASKLAQGVAIPVNDSLFRVTNTSAPVLSQPSTVVSGWVEESIASSCYSGFNGTQVTIEKKGSYQIDLRLATTGVSLTSSQRFECSIVVNGSRVIIGHRSPGTGESYSHCSTLSDTIRLEKGDVVSVEMSSQVSTSLTSSSTTNRWTMIRVGE